MMKCNICGNENQNQIYHVREMMYGFRDVFTYFQCSRCKCLQISDSPPDMSKYYPNNYYSYQQPPHRNSIRSMLSKIRDSYAVFEKGLLAKYLYARFPNEDLHRYLCNLPINKDTSILDVGCGSGEFLYSLRELGFKNLLGIEPFNVKEIRYDNGLIILKKYFHEIDNKWDVIIFSHSFEHVSDPLKTLQTVSKLLNNNGKCVIRMPTSSSYAWEHYGVNWVQLDAPRHYYIHSIESMNILVNEAGLDLYQVIYDSNEFQFWGSEQYLKDIPLLDARSYLLSPDKSIFSKEEMLAFKSRATELNKSNQGDQAIFYLKNPK